MAVNYNLRLQSDSAPKADLASLFSEMKVNAATTPITALAWTPVPLNLANYNSPLNNVSTTVLTLGSGNSLKFTVGSTGKYRVISTVNFDAGFSGVGSLRLNDVTDPIPPAVALAVYGPAFQVTAGNTTVVTLDTVVHCVQGTMYQVEYYTDATGTIGNSTDLSSRPTAPTSVSTPSTTVSIQKLD